MDQNRQKFTEKSEFRKMRSFDLAIRRAYFKAQIRRNYAKNVVINRSDNSKDMKARVIILVHDTLSHHALYMYQVSLKFLIRFSSYRVDTKLYGK